MHILMPLAGMKRWHVFLIGAAYGLLMRLVFGASSFLDPGLRTGANVAGGAMLAAFVVVVPVLIGFYTVYSVWSSGRPRLWLALVGPWVPICLFVLGTAVALIEGSICIVMALPIFLLAGSVGGLIGWLLHRITRKLPAGALHSVMLLPLLLGYGETRLPLPQEMQESTRSIHIAAPPAAVWQLINRATDIRPDEMGDGVAFRIGVPYPQEAVTHAGLDGRVRKLRWQHGIAFDEPITAWDENRFIRWTYAFKPDTFPPGTLDDHVVIGGRYFDLVDTSYGLTPQGDGTRLTIVVHYRVSTHFNWYAARVGRFLVEDSADAILRFYRVRSEHAT